VKNPHVPTNEYGGDQIRESVMLYDSTRLMIRNAMVIYRFWEVHKVFRFAIDWDSKA
jgi:hypothetical protein